MSPIPAQAARRRALPSPPTLTQFVVLSLLLHALVVVVFGSPAGRGGPAGWRNPLSVTLRSRVPESESVFGTTPGDERRRTGPAFPRAPERAPRAADQAPAPTLPSAEPARPTAVPPPAEDVLPRLDLGAPLEVDKTVVPQVKIVPLEEPPKAVPPLPPSAHAPKKPAPAAPPVAVPPDLPLGAAPSQDLPVSRSVETAPPQPMEAPKATVPQGEAPQRLERSAPAVEPAIPAPPEAPIPAPAPPARIEPRPQPNFAPLPEREVIPLPEPAPALREAPQFKFEPETPAPAPVVPPPPAAAPAAPAPVTAPPAAMPPPPVVAPRIESAPVQEATPAPAIPRAEPSLAPPTPAREGASRAPAPSESGRTADTAAPREPATESGPARLNFGAQPPIDDDMRRLVEPPTSVLAPPGARPRLSFEAPPNRDATRGNGRSTGLVQLNLAPPAPEPETKLGRAIQKAAQPDCRDAYAGLGLLAVPLLIADTITDKGCRW